VRVSAGASRAQKRTIPSDERVCASAHALGLWLPGAFHTDFMQPAVERLKEALAATPISTPRIPVISNVDAQPHADPDVIRDILARQARCAPANVLSAAGRAARRTHSDESLARLACVPSACMSDR
jgi:acyl transferase domain-containing protein